MKKMSRRLPLPRTKLPVVMYEKCCTIHLYFIHTNTSEATLTDEDIDQYLNDVSEDEPSHPRYYQFAKEINYPSEIKDVSYENGILRFTLVTSQSDNAEIAHRLRMQDGCMSSTYRSSFPGSCFIVPTRRNSRKILGAIDFRLNPIIIEDDIFELQPEDEKRCKFDLSDLDE